MREDCDQRSCLGPSFAPRRGELKESQCLCAKDVRGSARVLEHAKVAPAGVQAAPVIRAPSSYSPQGRVSVLVGAVFGTQIDLLVLIVG